MPPQPTTAGPTAPPAAATRGASAAASDPAVARLRTDADPGHVLRRMMRAAREHLGLEVAFIGEVSSDERIIRMCDAAPTFDGLQEGSSDPNEESYCAKVLSGELPEFLLDPAQHPVSAAIEATAALPVGTHLSVPIVFSDGRVYGTFCCFAREVRPALRREDLEAMRLVADLAAEYLESIEAAEAQRRARHDVVAAYLEADGLRIEFQPLVDVTSMAVVGVEALTRLKDSEHGPAWFFAEASAVGLGLEAEIHAVRLALGYLERIPPDVRLNLNVSPETLYSEAFFAAVADVPGHRLRIEVTEHDVVVDFAQMRAASARLEALGIGLAIDDVGMGWSGLNRILESAPRELKLDAAVIRGVDEDVVKQGLVHAFVAFGDRVDLEIVAEGIETQAELDMLRELGVRRGQGFHLGRPARLELALAAQEDPSVTTVIPDLAFGDTSGAGDRRQGRPHRSHQRSPI